MLPESRITDIDIGIGDWSNANSSYLPDIRNADNYTVWEYLLPVVIFHDISCYVYYYYIHWCQLGVILKLSQSR